MTCLSFIFFSHRVFVSSCQTPTAIYQISQQIAQASHCQYWILERDIEKNRNTIDLPFVQHIKWCGLVEITYLSCILIWSYNDGWKKFSEGDGSNWLDDGCSYRSTRVAKNTELVMRYREDSLYDGSSRISIWLGISEKERKIIDQVVYYVVSKIGYKRVGAKNCSDWILFYLWQSDDCMVVLITYLPNRVDQMDLSLISNFSNNIQAISCLRHQHLSYNIISFCYFRCFLINHHRPPFTAIHFASLLHYIVVYRKVT